MSYCEQTESRASYLSGGQMSAEELLLLEEKAVLTKAVEQLSLRRQGVAAARRKTEAEVRRQELKWDTPIHKAEETLRNSATECRQLQAEEKALRQVTADLARQRVEMESARQLAAREAGRAVKIETRIDWQETSQRPLTARTGIEEPGREVGCEEMRLVETQTRPSKTQDQPQAGLTLEQRLRAEIEGLAATQRKNIDAAQARLNVLRNNAARATTAA